MITKDKALDILARVVIWIGALTLVTGLLAAMTLGFTEWRFLALVTGTFSWVAAMVWAGKRLMP